MNDLVHVAYRNGSREKVLYALEHGANNWNLILYFACLHNHKDLALLMINKGANDYNGALVEASMSKNKDLILLMIEHGAAINKCLINLNEHDIDYLLSTDKVKDFGRFEHIANLCRTKRRDILAQIMTELNMRDIDTIIYLY